MEGYMIHADEWYPVYTIRPFPEAGTEYGDHIRNNTKIKPLQISDEDLAFIEQAFKQFGEAQDMLRKLEDV